MYRAVMRITNVEQPNSLGKGKFNITLRRNLCKSQITQYMICIQFLNDKS